MEYICSYRSPIGEMIMASDGEHLTGLWFQGQKYFASTLGEKYTDLQGDGSHLRVRSDKKWLDVYFAGEQPAFPSAPRTEGLCFSPAGVGDSAGDPIR